MKEVRNIQKVGFKDKSLRETDDIELLREAYEALLNAYQNEIKRSVMLEIELEDSRTAIKV